MGEVTVFINYRSKDAGWAVHLDGVLAERFGEERVFRASRSIKPSEDFVERILTSVRTAGVLLPVIGPTWLAMTDREGQPAIHGEQDWVRREIAEALEAGVAVMPVLVADAEPLRAEQLPADIERLARCQYLRLNHRSVEVDSRRIADEIARLMPVLGRSRPEDKGRRWPMLTAAALTAVMLTAAATITLWPDTQRAIDRAGAALPTASSTPEVTTTKARPKPSVTPPPTGVGGVSSSGGGGRSISKTAVPRPKNIAVDSGPWVESPGLFDVAQDCGSWRATRDDARHSGLRIRACSRRDGQTQTLAMQAASTDGHTHRFSLYVKAYSCVGGPGQCQDFGVHPSSFFAASIPAATIPERGTWSLISHHRNVPDGAHRCLALRGRARQDVTYAGSPLRLDPTLVQNDTEWQGKTPPPTCPAPSGWPNNH